MSRVLIVVIEDFPGGDTRVRRQAPTLSDAGHDVAVLAVRGPSEQREWKGVTIHRTVTKRRKTATTARRAWEYVAFFVESAVWISAHAGDFDVIQVANMPDFLTGAAFWPRRFRGVPVCLDVHDPMPELYATRNAEGRLGRLLVAQENYGVNRADALMTVNTPVGRILEARHPGTRVMVIPNVPDESFTPGPPRASWSPEGPVRLSYHGTVSARFGVERLVRAVRLLREVDGIDASLNVYGDGDALGRCRELSDGESWATYHGQVPGTALAGYLQQSDIGIVPYEDEPYMRIAYSNKAFELARVGVPMVLPSLAGVQEQFEARSAEWFTAGDTDSLVSAIRALVLDPARALSKAENAKVDLERFSWEEWGPRYVDFISSLARSPR